MISVSVPDGIISNSSTILLPLSKSQELTVGCLLFLLRSAFIGVHCFYFIELVARPIPSIPGVSAICFSICACLSMKDKSLLRSMAFVSLFLSCFSVNFCGFRAQERRYYWHWNLEADILGCSLLFSIFA